MNYEGTFFTACCESSILIKIEGWAIRSNSLFFKDFIDSMIEEGFKDFIIDLLECKGMDSTFMGTLICIVSEVKTQKIPVTLTNLNPSHQNLLENLGIITMLNISKQQIDIPKNEMQSLLVNTSSNTKRHFELIKKAHECLVNVNEKNKQKFGQFLEILDQELQQ